MYIYIHISTTDQVVDGLYIYILPHLACCSYFTGTVIIGGGAAGAVILCLFGILSNYYIKKRNAIGT